MIKINAANITINIGDMEKSIAFYQSIGIELKNRWGDHYAQLEAPGITIGLHPSADFINENSVSNISIGFTCEDFEETRKMLNDLSIDVKERNEDGGQFLEFRDPDGTNLYFINPKW